MLETTNLKLKKLQLSDAADITAMNGNWDTLDEDITVLREERAATVSHRGDGVIHINAEERETWNSKAAGEHAHPLLYAPISHSNNDSIHVTADERTAWNGKAEGSHSHSAANITDGVLAVARGGTGVQSAQAFRSAMGLGDTLAALPIASGGTNAATVEAARANLGAAPAGYGLGENLYANFVTNPLDPTLPMGIYGFSTYHGGVNGPQVNMLGHIEVYPWGSNSFRYVKAVDQDSGKAYYNRYNENAQAWTGWITAADCLYTRTSAMEYTGGQTRTYSYTVPFVPTCVIFDTGMFQNTSGVGQLSSRVVFPGKSGCCLNTGSGGSVTLSLSGNTVTLAYNVITAHNLYWMAM